MSATEADRLTAEASGPTASSAPQGGPKAAADVDAPREEAPSAGEKDAASTASDVLPEGGATEENGNTVKHSSSWSWHDLRREAYSLLGAPGKKYTALCGPRWDIYSVKGPCDYKDVHLQVSRMPPSHALCRPAQTALRRCHESDSTTCAVVRRLVGLRPPVPSPMSCVCDAWSEDVWPSHAEDAIKTAFFMFAESLAKEKKCRVNCKCTVKSGGKQCNLEAAASDSARDDVFSIASGDVGVARTVPVTIRVTFERIEGGEHVQTPFDIFFAVFTMPAPYVPPRNPIRTACREEAISKNATLRLEVVREHDLVAPRLTFEIFDGSGRFAVHLEPVTTAFADDTLAYLERTPLPHWPRFCRVRRAPAVCAPEKDNESVPRTPPTSSVDNAAAKTLGAGSHCAALERLLHADVNSNADCFCVALIAVAREESGVVRRWSLLHAKGAALPVWRAYDPNVDGATARARADLELAGVDNRPTSIPVVVLRVNKYNEAFGTGGRLALQAQVGHLWRLQRADRRASRLSLSPPIPRREGLNVALRAEPTAASKASPPRAKKAADHAVDFAAVRPYGDYAAMLLSRFYLLRNADDAINKLAAAFQFDPWTVCEKRDTVTDKIFQQKYTGLIAEWDAHASRFVELLLRVLGAAASDAKHSHPKEYHAVMTAARVAGSTAAGATIAVATPYFSGLQAVAVFMAVSSPALMRGSVLDLLTGVARDAPRLFSRCLLEKFIKNYRRVASAYGWVQSAASAVWPTASLIPALWKLASVPGKIWPNAAAPWVLWAMSILKVPYADEMMAVHRRQGEDQGAQDCITYLLKLLAESDDSAPVMRRDDMPKTVAAVEKLLTRRTPRRRA